jgi:transposase-like protein
MKTNGVGAGMRRRSRAEVERLVSEFQQSGLDRKEFCAAHGLSVHTLDAWRRRIAGFRQEIVPVKIVADRAAPKSAMRAASLEQGGQFRVALADGLRIKVKPGFDAAELRRLIAALDSMPLRNGSRPPV